MDSEVQITSVWHLLKERSTTELITHSQDTTIQKTLNNQLI